MKKISKKREHIKKHIDKKLRSRLRLYFIIAAVMVLIVLYNFVVGKLGFALSLFGVTGGIVIGIFSSRMFHISWDHDANKVVSQLDVVGGIVLAIYIGSEITREWLFKHYINNALAGALTFAFLAGVMIGRVLGTRGRILQVLTEQKVFSKK